MRYKNLILTALAGLALSVAVYAQDVLTPTKTINGETGIVKTINNHKYLFTDNKVTQLTKDDDNQARYAVLPEINGDYENAKILANIFTKRNIDGFILPGNIVENKEIEIIPGKTASNLPKEKTTKRKEIFTNYIRNIDDELDIKSKQPERRYSLEEIVNIFAETGLPVFMIPGTNETQEEYNSLNLPPNVIDMNKYPVFRGDDVDLTALPGYPTTSPSPLKRDDIPGRFPLDKETMRKIGELGKRQDKPVLLISNRVGKIDSSWDEERRQFEQLGKFVERAKVEGDKRTPGTCYTSWESPILYSDNGDQEISNTMKKNNIQFAAGGYAPHSAGIARKINGERVEVNQWADEFIANMGAVRSHRNRCEGGEYIYRAGIITIKGDKVKFVIWNLFDREITAEYRKKLLKKTIYITDYLKETFEKRLKDHPFKNRLIQDMTIYRLTDYGYRP